MEINFTLSLPHDRASIPVVRHICGDALARLGVVRHCIHDIQLAVTEACTNVLEHAWGTDQEYEVEFAVDDHRCEVTVRDTGLGFDSEAKRGRPSDASESGRGILLMSALVDELRFVSKPEDGTVVHLEKKLDLTDGSVLRALSPLAG